MMVPPALLASLEGIPGFSRQEFEQAHLSGHPVVSLRLNPLKHAIPEHMCWYSLMTGRVPWSATGYYLQSRPSFTLDPLFHAGAYYVQEASSMFLEQAFLQHTPATQPLRVLDLCAAPGGKSTHLLSLLPPRSLLVCNEVIRQRVNILVENLIKWGSPGVVVTNNDPADFQRLPGFFDVLVVDAPCSGSGLFRKEPASLDEWSEANVQLCSRRQQRILADVLPSLAAGGLLIYSTCSYSPEEDEQIADWLMGEQGLEPLMITLDPAWGITACGDGISHAPGYRFFPYRLMGEGFYMAVFRKTGDLRVSSTGIKYKLPIDKAGADDKAVIRPLLKDADDWYLFRQHQQLVAFPIAQEDALNLLRAALYIRMAGTELGTVIRHQLVPAHALALSTIRGLGWPEWDLEEPDALQYLRRQEIASLPVSRGWVMVTFRKMPLGWVKVLPGRVNNYYPKDWRILNK